MWSCKLYLLVFFYKQYLNNLRQNILLSEDLPMILTI